MPTQNIYDLVDTWNAAGTTFTGIGLDVTDTASATGSFLMRLQTGGTNRFAVTKFNATEWGVVVGNNGILSFGNQLYLRNAALSADAVVNAAQFVATSASGVVLPTNAVLNFTDASLTRRAAANLRLGAADAAAPVAQTLSVQSVVAGTTNTAGANLTITGSQGTGTGAGGSIIFQVAPAGAVSNGVQNALATALTINSAGQMIGGAGSASVPTFAFTDTNYGVGQSGMFYAANGVAFGGAGGSYYLSISNQALTLSSGVPLAWSSGNGTPGSADTILRRDAAGVVGVRGSSSTTGGALSFIEQTAPSAPATNGVRIYAEDNGSGKTRLMALFPTGAAVQIAIEP